MAALDAARAARLEKLFYLMRVGYGAAALAVYARFHPDWVLLDIAMKQVNGITATRQITEAFPAARVVIVTNHRDAALREAADQAGARGYVLKEDLWAVRGIISGGQ